MSTEEHKKTGITLQKFKVILLGDVGVGKTSFFLRVKDNEFHEKSPSSIGIDSCFKRFRVDERDVQICLWDTAGVERFRTLTRNFYRNTQAVLLVFAVNDPASLYYLNTWEQDSVEYAPNALKFLIGTKTDQEHTVTQETIESFATNHNCEYAFLTSAKTGQGVLNALSAVTECLVSFYNQDKYTLENSWLEESIFVNQGTHNVKNKTCC